MKSELIQISPGNMKTGRIPAVSLSPGLSCPKDAPCRKDCYAAKICRCSPDARRAYARNLRILNRYPADYWYQIREYLRKKNPRFFRFHVSGDIVDQHYLERMKETAGYFPETRLLAFTKNHGLNFKGLPLNLNVVFSMWNNWGNTRKSMPRAWMLDPKDPDPRIPADAIECPGNCETCGMCWSLGKGQSVVFYKH